MRVRITRDTCSPLWVVRCAAECSECRRGRELGAMARDGLPAVCWLTSGLDRARVIGLCIERGWTIEGMERAA
jgi:hypothetical protein